jgi:hypothetical protein
MIKQVFSKTSMKKLIFFTCSFFLVQKMPAQVTAQKIQTDTVMTGYYIPLDSDVISYTVTISSNGLMFGEKMIGSRLSPSLVYKITHLSSGATVTYSFNINENGLIYPRPVVRYVIGKHNSTSKAIQPVRSQG